jgi:hypothetical protein
MKVPSSKFQVPSKFQWGKLQWAALLVCVGVMAGPPFVGNPRSPYRLIPAAAAGGGGGVGSPGIENTQTTNTTAASSTCSIGINVGSTGLNRLMAVWVSQCGAKLNGVTVGGSSATEAGRQQLMSYTCSNALYYLVAPATGVQTVTATFSAAPGEVSMVIHSWTNVNQSTPVGTFASFCNTATTVSSITNTIGCADRDTGYDALNYYEANTMTPDSGQTLKATAFVSGKTSLKSSIRTITTTTTNMIWNASPASELAAGAVAIKGVP